MYKRKQDSGNAEFPTSPSELPLVHDEDEEDEDDEILRDVDDEIADAGKK